MQAKIEMISPSYARQLLEQGISNRPISETAVLRYARDMADGKWQSNGQGIVLTESGMMLDGQHRMHAVIRADVTVGMLVVRGISQEHFSTLDSGRSRTLADVLSVDGFKNSNQLAVVARMAYNYTVGNHLRDAPTKATLRDFVADHPYLAEMANYAISNSGKGPIRRLNTSLGAVLFLANSKHRFDPEVMEFQGGIASGSGLFAGDSRLSIREWMLNHASKGTTMVTADVIFSAVAKAWNAFSMGDATRLIRPVPNANRDTLRINGFERAFFNKVRDMPQVRVRAMAPGKNTQDLAGRPVDRLGAR